MGRRKGSVYFHAPSGRWCASLTLMSAGGKRERVVRYADSREEAEALLAELVARYLKGTLPRPEAVTLAEWAQSWWERKRKEVRPRTAAMYRDELAYALPSLKTPQAPDPLGRMRLQAVQPAHIRAVLDSLAERGLSVRTLRMVRQRLHAVFEEALNLEMIPRNPVAPVKVKAPRGREKAGRALEPAEVAALLKALEAHPDPRTAMALRLMLNLGLRRGEALGLQWGDIDLEAGLLTVRRVWTESEGKALVTEPKTASSRRVVPIPHQTLERLKVYKTWWEGVYGEAKAEAWAFPGEDPSRPLNPHAPNWALRRICQRLGLPPVRVHDLRHTYGSLLLAAGAPVELVAERMGHANPNITLGVYRHLLEEERRGFVVDPEELLANRPKA